MAAMSMAVLIGCVVGSGLLYRYASAEAVAAVDVALDTHDGPRFIAVAGPSATASLVDEQSKPAQLEIIRGRVPDGGTLASSLAQRGVQIERIQAVTEAMRPHFDFRRAKAGDVFAFVQSDAGELVSFEYQSGRSLYRVVPGPDDGLLTEVTEPQMERRVVTLGGLVQRSLTESLLAKGETAELVQLFSDVFVWTMDFSTQTRPGDEYRIVYEKFYDRAGFVRYGGVLAAQYVSGRDTLTAFYYQHRDGEGGYYTAQGRSMRGSLLRAPLRYTRISSRFTKSRLHPIEKVYKPHPAIDYAAPTGTEIWAAGDGKVTFKGWMKGLGHTVKIRHGNGFESIYGHLSRYAKGLKVGNFVRQRDVIGYVGMSGSATGPHLDYRLQYKGKYIDPLKLTFNSDRIITPSEWPRFESVIQESLALLNEASPPIRLEAAM